MTSRNIVGKQNPSISLGRRVAFWFSVVTAGFAAFVVFFLAAMFLLGLGMAAVAWTACETGLVPGVCAIFQP